jgi:hypothetical protein
MLAKLTDGAEHAGWSSCEIMHGSWSSGPHEESETCLCKLYCKLGLNLKCIAQGHCKFCSVNIYLQCATEYTER